MKKIFQQISQSAFLQPLWKKLFHVSKVAMNYWGGGSFLYSGELNCFEKLFRQYKNEQGFVFFDVGANEGNYLLAVDKIMKQGNTTGPVKYEIHCFEPSAKTFLTLRENVPSAAHIFMNNFGFGEMAQEEILYVPDKGNVLASGFSKHITTRAIKDYTEEKIQIQTIDQYCRQNKITRIHFLKIDVEGFELNVLKGASEMLENNAIEMIQFEFGECMIDARVFFRDFWNLLHEQFELYRILQNGKVYIHQYNEEFEVFHCANYLAVNKNR